MRFYSVKIAARYAFRNNTLSFAKLFGLGFSFAVILFAAGFVYFETTFDRHVPDHRRIYRCLMEGRINSKDESFAVTSPQQAAAMVNEIPEIRESIRIMAQGEPTMTYNNEDYKFGQLYLADPAFFSFFGIPLIAGNSTPLAANDNLVIAESIAKNNFGSAEEALGKTVKIRGEQCIITGIFPDLPGNFHLQPKMIMSLQRSNPDQEGWDSQNFNTYIKTEKPVQNLNDLNFKITKTVYTHYNTDGQIDGKNAQTWEDLKYTPDLFLFFTVEPLSAIHFSSHKFDPAITANRYYVYGAVILALLILLISSVNYVNLTMASISTRFKDIGIQKTSGARDRHIIRQFIMESLLFLVAGYILAVFIFQISKQPIANYLNLQLITSGSGMLKIIMLSLAALLLFNLATIVAPVIVISKRNILRLIKEEDHQKGGFSVNFYFVMLQFILSGIIILSSVFVQKQVNLMVSKDRGYDTDNVMMLTMWQMNPETRRSFLEELKKYDVVKSVATSDRYFGEELGTTSAFFDVVDESNYFHTSTLPVDDAFLNTFNFEMKEGRFFEKERQSDFETIILNETAAGYYQGKESLIGRTVFLFDKKYTVLGIIRDFNYRSLHHPIQPLALTRIDNLGNVFIKIANNKIPDAVDIMQQLWKKYNISVPLDYTFHDQVIATYYAKDQQAKKLLLILSVISIVIACVGLYAISFFRIVRRTKEIGIRKVNGANVAEVMSMLNMDFLKWVIIAFIISCPIAWYAMHQWLQNFAFKTDLSWWVFAGAGAVAVTVALLTVSWQSYKAATRNPVEALRYE